MSTEFTLPRRRRRIRPYLDLTAMIDTVFNLLIFFAVTMTYVGARSAMPVHLPSAQTARPVNERVVLTLLPGRATQVNGNATMLNQLGAAIKQAAKGNLDTQVVVVADEKVSYAQLVAVLDSVRLAKFNRIALAANPKKVNEAAADFTRAVE
jgi:biopolymer transport protein ExbD